MFATSSGCLVRDRLPLLPGAERRPESAIGSLVRPKAPTDYPGATTESAPLHRERVRGRESGEWESCTGVERDRGARDMGQRASGSSFARSVPHPVVAGAVVSAAVTSISCLSTGLAQNGRDTGRGASISPVVPRVPEDQDGAPSAGLW